MAEQERSGPTPAQEALARAKMRRRGYQPETFIYEVMRPQAEDEAQADLDAIEAGEVPGVFAADGERPRRALWAVIAEAAGGRLSDDDARRIARAVEEEQDHD